MIIFHKSQSYIGKYPKLFKYLLKDLDFFLSYNIVESLTAKKHPGQSILNHNISYNYNKKNNFHINN